MINESDSDESFSRVRICPNNNCSFDLHAEGANFCILCGTLLYQRCDDCSVVNPRYAKFCHRCGTSVEDLRNFSSRFEEEDITETDEEIEE